MSFCCPIHGYYSPVPGGTAALCPSCTSASPVVMTMGVPPPPAITDAMIEGAAEWFAGQRGDDVEPDDNDRAYARAVLVAALEGTGS